MNAARAAGPRGSVRIVGGRWRGTRLPVADAAGLRPSSDRVRETLFNWLQPALPGARVLDLFAGSGALGFEAVSRGAREAVLVERDPGLSASLRATAGRLGAGDAIRVVQADAIPWLAGASGGADGRFDIVFVDPPFGAGLWPAALEALPAVAAEGAWLYLESPVATPSRPDAAWAPHREGATREAHYALYRWRGGLSAGAATLPDGPVTGGATPR